MASVVPFGPGLTYLLLHLLSRCFNFQFIFLKIKSSPSPGDVRELVLCFFLPFEHHLSALDEKIFLFMVPLWRTLRFIHDPFLFDGIFLFRRTQRLLGLGRTKK